MYKYPKLQIARKTTNSKRCIDIIHLMWIKRRLLCCKMLKYIENLKFGIDIYAPKIYNSCIKSPCACMCANVCAYNSTVTE